MNKKVKLVLTILAALALLAAPLGLVIDSGTESDTTNGGILPMVSAGDCETGYGYGYGGTCCNKGGSGC